MRTLIEQHPIPDDASAAELRALADAGLVHWNRKKRAQVLDFVGFVNLDGPELVCCLPKVAEGADDTAVVELYRVLSRYSSTLKRRWREGLDDPHFRHGFGDDIDRFLRLLEVTETHGWASDYERVTSLDDRSPIDWPGTLKQCVALHTRTGVLYAEPRRNRLNRTRTALAPLQALALEELHGRLGPLAARIVPPTHWALEEAGGLADPVRELERPLLADLLLDCARETNRDHHHELVEILKPHFGLAAGGPAVGQLGTTTFHTVWEAICRHILGGGTTPHSQVAARLGFEPSGEPPMRSGVLKSQVPDILLREGTDIDVLDAKYYDPRSHGPPTTDGVKQAFYELSIEPRFTVRSNAYILPCSGEAVRVLGTYAFEIGTEADPRFPSICALGLPYQLAVRCYLGEVDPAPVAAELLELARSHRGETS